MKWFLKEFGLWLMLALLCGGMLPDTVQLWRYKLIPFSEALVKVEQGQIQTVAIDGYSVQLCTPISQDKKRECFRARHGSDLTAFERAAKTAKASVTYQDSHVGLSNILLTLAGLIGLSYLGVRISDRITSVTKDVRQKRDRDVVGEAGKLAGKTGVTFADVAGNAGPKRDLAEIVDGLKHPKNFARLGAKVPRGTLLCGPSGTGKTLLAKAVAGEADVPFLQLGGSDLNGVYMGTGIQRIKDLFAVAGQMAETFGACIVFIDEIDSIGSRRLNDPGSAAGKDANSALNALLVAMDGFDSNSRVIVLAATNLPDSLDPALLRPGRFDRRIQFSAPTAADRLQILQLHSRRVRMSQDTDWTKIARLTPGMVGADLANVIDEAARLAAREKADAVTDAHMADAVEHLIVGYRNVGFRLSDSDRKAVAVHESGHAIALAADGQGHRVATVSIVTTVRGALGYNLTLPEDEADAALQTRDELVASIRHLLGGRAAEEVMLGQVTTGASDDLRRANAIARRMVEQFGMSKQLPNLSLIGNDPWAEATRRIVDQEVQEIINLAYNETKRIMQANISVLQVMTVLLLEQEEIEGQLLTERLSGIHHYENT